jgi:CBS domain-containing protein
MLIILKIISELNDACMKQVIRIVLDKTNHKPPVDFVWLAMGSQGRGEQLLRTDQDNAILFADVEEENLAPIRSYFLKFARQVNKGMRTIGYEYCPAEMMASNNNWCLSLSDWKHQTSRWITNPGKDEVLLSSIFFDYNPVYGNTDLVGSLTEHIFEAVRENPPFLLHLASGALQNPSPTGFFRQFLLEQDGEYKDFFDLKRRALMPLTDAARVLILNHNIKSINNTPERFEKLAELETNNKELFMSCSYATKALLKFRAKQGLLHNDSGRFIALDALTKEEKVKLKRTFKTVKELQELLKIRFRVPNLIV